MNDKNVRKNVFVVCNTIMKGETYCGFDCVKIVSEMKRQRLTSMDLANKAMCGLSTVQSARNERSISTNSARRLAAALGVPLDELIESEV